MYSTSVTNLTRIHATSWPSSTNGFWGLCWVRYTAGYVIYEGHLGHLKELRGLSLVLQETPSGYFAPHVSGQGGILPDQRDFLEQPINTRNGFD